MAEFEEGRAGIEQAVDALARQQLAARLVLLRCSSGPPCETSAVFSRRSSTSARMAAALAR
jgi:hypothetical protein